ncbi:MAG: branched-chain amino acid ABC transporter substrate-binding protein [Chroococcidiopsidaceae cyanobacterium CP_BM_ER_R8_30]|nr:branched-chain amino acid ABC transporter substrate-binding protein [Chroococcidiopsidaceae cyanobacterium CP_BM_ER_R8_30]
MNLCFQKSRIRHFIWVLWVISICSSCGANGQPGGDASADNGNTVKIVSSFPLTGSDVGQDQTIVNGIKQALSEANYTACSGKLKIDYQSLDDATAASGKWDPAQETANANKAVAEKNVVAYIGTFNSGAAKLSIPILNQANIFMVSPANTYPGLTKAVKGSTAPNEPNVYYPNGKRNYARVVATDDLQGKLAANWAKLLGVKKVYILDDQELYGKGIADIFEEDSKKLGIQVLGHEGIDPKAADYKALMTKIKALNPDLIYFGGITANNAGQLVKDMRSVGMAPDQVKFMGPDGIFDQAFADAAGPAGNGAYATFLGLPPKELTGAGQKWYKSYKSTYHSEPEPYASYGYESAEVVINAINKVCKNDRDALREAAMNTKDLKGLSGTFSFDKNGDTTLAIGSGNEVKNGKWTFVKMLKF